MSIIEKLKSEVARYQNKPFLKSAMAVCALTALADDELSLSERYKVDDILATMDSLNAHNPHKAVAILDDYLDHLRTDPEKAISVLEGKIARHAGNYKQARTLLRIAYLVIDADGKITSAERDVFERLCVTLAVDGQEVWGKLDDVA